MALIIDKLAFTLQPVTDKSHLMDHLGEVLSEEALADHRLRFDARPFSRGRRYRYAGILSHDGAPLCFLQAVPLQERKVAFMRLEFNPAKIGERGLKRVRRLLRHVFLDQYEAVIAKAKITRLDLAADFDGIRLGSLAVTDAHKRKAGLWLGATGEVETIYLGSRDSDAHLRIYDKARELREQQHISLSGERLRVEATIANRRFRLSELRALPNPFAGLVIVDLGTLETNDEPAYRFQFFLDSCRQRGAHSALRLIADKPTQARYRKCLAGAKVDWWAPDALWRGLPQALSGLNLFPARAFARPDEPKKPKKSTKRNGAKRR